MYGGPLPREGWSCFSDACLGAGASLTLVLPGPQRPPCLLELAAELGAGRGPECRPSSGAWSLAGGWAGRGWRLCGPCLRLSGCSSWGGGAPLSSGQNSPSGVTCDLIGPPSQGTCAGDSGTCRGLDGRWGGQEERAPGGGRRSPRAVREGPSVQAEAAHAATRDRPVEPQCWGWRSCGRRARPGAAKTDDGGAGDTAARAASVQRDSRWSWGSQAIPCSWRAAASSLLCDASVDTPECVPQPGLQPGTAEAIPTDGAPDPAWLAPSGVTRG